MVDVSKVLYKSTHFVPPRPSDRSVADVGMTVLLGPRIKISRSVILSESSVLREDDDIYI